MLPMVCPIHCALDLLWMCSTQRISNYTASFMHPGSKETFHCKLNLYMLHSLVHPESNELTDHAQGNYSSCM